MVAAFLSPYPYHGGLCSDANVVFNHLCSCSQSPTHTSASNLNRNPLINHIGLLCHHYFGPSCVPFLGWGDIPMLLLHRKSLTHDPQHQECQRGQACPTWPGWLFLAVASICATWVNHMHFPCMSVSQNQSLSLCIVNKSKHTTIFNF